MLLLPQSCGSLLKKEWSIGKLAFITNSPAGRDVAQETVAAQECETTNESQEFKSGEHILHVEIKNKNFYHNWPITKTQRKQRANQKGHRYHARKKGAKNKIIAVWKWREVAKRLHVKKARSNRKWRKVPEWLLRVKKARTGRFVARGNGSKHLNSPKKTCFIVKNCLYVFVCETFIHEHLRFSKNLVIFTAINITCKTTRNKSKSSLIKSRNLIYKEKSRWRGDFLFSSILKSPVSLKKWFQTDDKLKRMMQVRQV